MPKVNTTAATVETTPTTAEVAQTAEPKAKKAPKAKKTTEKAPESPKPEAPKTKGKGKGSKKDETPKAPETKPEEKAPESKPRGKKEGLRKAQVRILQFLLKTGKAENRNTISAGAPCDLANCTELLGSHDPEKRAANDVRYFPSLLSLGFVKAEQHDVDGKDVVQYSLTANGRKTAAKL